MFNNYFKVALRYLLRYKEYTIINILGLGVGVTCCVLIMAFVRSEFSYDRFHNKADRLYRCWVREKYDKQDDIIDMVTPLPLAGALQSSFPEVEQTCRIYNFSSLARIDRNAFSDNICMTDSTFFKMFDFDFSEGNRAKPFPTGNTIVLTEATAKKYFGNTAVIGKTVELQLGNEKVNFSVAGVVRDPPEESSVKFNALIPFSNERFLFSQKARTAWFNVSPETYVLLKEGVDPMQLAAKFPSMVKQHLGADYKEGMYVVNLQPITEIHLDNSLPAGIQPISNPKYSYILASIGALILLVACINFITLSIGRSATRALEVGVRKVLGAQRRQLIRQFWGEAILVTLASVVLGTALSLVLITPFNSIINRELDVHFDLLFVVFSLLLIIIIGMIAGIYPALVLSGFKPIEVLKGKIKSIGGSGLLRRTLITGQFITSICMIVCTVIIGEQLNYLRMKDLGYNGHQVVIVQTNKPRLKGMELADLYRNEILKNPQVTGASTSLMSFAETPWIAIGYNDDKGVYRTFQFNAVDPWFVKTMGIKVIQGRDFSADNPADYTASILVNEALVKQYGWKNPVGQKLPGRISQQIIGVVKDFNFESLHTPIQPLVLAVKPDTLFRRIDNISYNAPLQPRVSVMLKAGDLTSNIAALKQAWKSVAPDQDFEYRFLDESIASQYEQEQRTGRVVKLASVLSIFIACMGLFGLATLVVVRRTKEIGIRKVLGASVHSIVALLSKDFLVMIFIAAIIAFPLAWWAMSTWLRDFAYRIDMPLWVFPLAAAVASLVALLTISLQSVKAATANPVKSLRTE